MHAWKFTQAGVPPVLSEVPGQVRRPCQIANRTDAAGLCRSDVGLVDGTPVSLAAGLPARLVTVRK